ncbi:tautomerase family protein [Streptomyces sp. 4F14]|uniref:tautomerase family protein n=1 Tax=Streptomyces sp. 4F14 TaxID=3394380 RepID=UPI003A87E091
MPHCTVHLGEEALAGQETKLIVALTDAVGSVFGDDFRKLVGVDLIGVPAHRRGTGGVVTGGATPQITLSMREGAYRHPGVPEAPARLVGAITDAVAGVLGEETRERTLVTLVGVPEGRSGVGGRLV